MGLLVDVHKRLGDFTLDVSFEVRDARETLALLGPSGCGKSLTLKCVAGVLTPDEGRIVLNDRVLFDAAAHVNVHAQDRRVGYLFQNYALFPTMTVEQNIMAGVRSGSRAERRARAAEQICAFRLEGLERRRPSELSGGQQQRVALARIMANEPELLLLDEPFSALDGYLRWQLELELTDTLRRFAGGAVFVSHSRDEVYRMSDKVCVIDGGSCGRMMATHELFDAPETLAEALISGCKNVSAAEPTSATSLACADWGVTLDCGRDVTGCTHAGIRAHFLRIVEADGRAVDTIGGAATGFGSTRGGVAAPGGASGAAPSPCPAAVGDADEELVRSFRSNSGSEGRLTSESAYKLEAVGAGAAEGVARAVAGSVGAPALLNRIPCTVERVIDNVFSTIVMCATPGGASLRVELSKDAWAALGDPSHVVLEVAPKDVMPLKGARRGPAAGATNLRGADDGHKQAAHA